ncbi:PHP domain-containing protein [Paenibacillus sp. GSMTC-2017]|uniref:PHP domain-containing protein n=1 Tax=Paenibacillus sp. GSMTC-2017 TaxID=2794350 RepID=UPI0018D81654|nr:PHP domain-containing protein [Paenibacillus sp. GSMTC-2017]MBH5316773.1 PHP domain-containing protein [Paenibacillus sp. GSMTC-2017]
MALIKGDKVDLHTHTTASDGIHAPTVVVQMAKAAGLGAVAITDHDTVAGVSEAVAEGERIGITVVPGVELSTVADQNDIHLLAYYTNNEDVQWQDRLAQLGNTRERRNELIVQKLQSMGISITMDELIAVALNRQKENASSDSKFSIGRPHIAELLISKGIVESMNEAFERFLASGAAAYVEVPRVHPLEAIQWIREAGGVCVIAHPGLYKNDALVEDIIRGGAHGIEVFHSDHSMEEEEKYSLFAKRYKLIETGGSDFHGMRSGQSYHGAIGSKNVAYSVIEQLQMEKDR